MVETCRPFGGFYDVEEADVRIGSCQAKAPDRPVGCYQELLGYQPGQNQNQGPLGNGHLGGDLTRLAQTLLVVAAHRDLTNAFVNRPTLKTKMTEAGILGTAYRVELCGS